MNIRDPFDHNDFFPELTPLIDILFLLLIFFMLTTTFLKETRHETIPVELPEARHSDVITAERAVVITVDEKGDYSVDGRNCSAATLPQLLKLKTVSSDTTIVISGHAKAPYRSIILIYDILQSLGISRFTHDVK